VIEADESHLFTAIISFDEDDLASAVAELESRYRALAGNAYTVADQFISAYEAGTANLAPDVAARLAKLCVKSYSVGNVVLAVWADDPRYSVVVLDDHGRAASCEFFDEHQWNAALVRFDELTTL
jgi:hypothetical protein